MTSIIVAYNVTPTTLQKVETLADADIVPVRIRAGSPIILG